jgi:hypothetical protein
MPKDNSFIILAPSTGIAQSPLIGYQDVRNLDIFSTPGIVKLNNALAKESASVIENQPLWIVKNNASPTNLYCLDAGGVVYKSTDSGDSWSKVTGNTAGGVGQGLIVWKDYLFVAYGTGIDVYGPLSGSAAWSKAWLALTNDSAFQPMLVSALDGNLYVGNGRYIGKISENSGQNFAPGTPATYTATATSLTLPEDYRVKCLAEQGNNLMIGTWQGTNVYDVKKADIFPWDCSSTTYGQPIQIAECGVHALLTINNFLYILAGVDGAVYKSDGTSAVKIVQIPQSIADLSGGKYLEWYPGAICNYKNRLTFGVGEGGTAATIAGMGVYSLAETSRGTILTHEHTISTGNDGSSTIVKVSALCPITRDQITVGWKDGTSYGIDRTNTAAYTTSYAGYYITPLYKVGRNLTPKKLSDIEFQLVKKLASNEGVKIEYRTNLTDSFTTLGTYPYSTHSAKFILSYFLNLLNHGTSGIPECEWLQLKISLTGTTTTPQLYGLILE